jgi:hypothetical protein
MGGGSGELYLEGKKTAIFHNKREALAALKKLRKGGRISATEASWVLKRIQEDKQIP